MARVVCLPGDGIGPEVMAEAVRVLDALGVAHEEHLIGGAAIDAAGEPLPPDTLAAAREADAVLLGAVGGPAWKPGAAEKGLIDLRGELEVYANLRPAVLLAPGPQGAPRHPLTGALPERSSLRAGRCQVVRNRRWRR